MICHHFFGIHRSPTCVSWGSDFRSQSRNQIFLDVMLIWITRCGPYFGTIVEAVYQMKGNIWTCKKETKRTLFWGVWEKEFLYVVAKLPAKSKKPWKISLSYSFAVEMGHFDTIRWKYDSVCIFSMLRDALELILWKKADKKCKDQKREHFFEKGALTGKSIFQIQRINVVHGRCSSSSVLRDIPSNFTRSVGRQFVIQFWALSGGIDTLPWPTFQANALTYSDKCTANTGPSPNCVPLAHVRWNEKWCCFSLKETDMSTEKQFQNVLI